MQARPYQGRKNRSQGCTLLERKTFFMVLTPLHNAALCNRFDAAMHLSMADDNVREMAYRKMLSQAKGIKVPFAHRTVLGSSASMMRTPMACCAKPCPRTQT